MVNAEAAILDQNEGKENKTSHLHTHWGLQSTHLADNVRWTSEEATQAETSRFLDDARYFFKKRVQRVKQAKIMAFF